MQPEQTRNKILTNSSRILPRKTKMNRVEEDGYDRWIDVRLVDRVLIPIATAICCFLWLFLLAAVYTLVPTTSENLVYLEGIERAAAMAGFFILCVNTSQTMMPFFITRYKRNYKEWPGIVWAALLTQGITVFSNALLAFAPTVVMVDPVTHARVYLIRWCAWVPLAGLMTFLAEIVDCQNGIYGILIPVMVGMSQFLASTCALVFPFCPNATCWVLFMMLACTLWLTIFPRLCQKYQFFKNTKQGITLTEAERYTRVKFGYQLLLTCSVVWSLLVFQYFSTMVIFRTFPEGHYLRHQSLPMILDTFFDVVAKAFYMKVILEVHESVFDADGRATRQLFELRRMISVLWERSSDVLVISVRHGMKLTTMFSPTFPEMIRARDSPQVDIDDHASTSSVALMVQTKEFEIESSEARRNMESVAYFIPSSEIPFATDEGNCVISVPRDEMHGLVVKEAERIIAAAWARVDGADDHQGKANEKKDELIVHEVVHTNGSRLKCELKLSRRAGNAVIAVVRDVTELHLRFDAERRTHTETLARQKDAQAINRFTKHEIKNGLLAGIELCQEVSKQIETFKALNSIAEEEVDSTMAKYITDLSSTLHEVLDTVLAEAMAREVVHESYNPKLERVDVLEILSTSGFIEDGTTKRFPVSIFPPNIPFLSMDPQLLRYIHRNAVSNACKYGRKGGIVRTDVHFDEIAKTFKMDVVNEPGEQNRELMMLGEEASNIVFNQGTRLQVHIVDNEGSDETSAGDGAWIMQKCAKTLGGFCKIRFGLLQTVFTFSCPAEAYTLPWKGNQQFKVPPGTWGIAVDDSSIQRRLMTRILLYAGVEESRIIVLGEKAADVEELDQLLIKILNQDLTSKILILVDENLEYNTREVHTHLSGSKYTEVALKKVRPEQEARVLALVRSAYDSVADVAMYNSRAHGFFPKASMHREKVREVLAPAWQQRFPQEVADPEHDVWGQRGLLDAREKFSTLSQDIITRHELLESLQNVESLLTAEPNIRWDRLWGALHALKGDLMIFDDSNNFSFAVQLINSMRGQVRPDDFQNQWEKIRQLIINEAKDEKKIGLGSLPADSRWQGQHARKDSPYSLRSLPSLHERLIEHENDEDDPEDGQETKNQDNSTISSGQPTCGTSVSTGAT